MNAPANILVRGVNWLGDAVMTTPALMRLRERFPQAQITILTPEKLGPLYLHHPAIDRVLMFAPREPVLGVAAWLREERFDLGIILPNSPRSALEQFLGRVRERAGFARPWRTWMLTRKVIDRGDIPLMRKRSEKEVRERIAAGAQRETFDLAGHHLHGYLRLAASVGCNPAPVPPTLRVTQEEMAAAGAQFDLPHDRLVLGLNGGAEYGPAKRWPEDRFAAAAIELHRTLRCVWVIFGGSADRDLADRLTAGITASIGAGNVRNIAGRTSLRELCATLRQCRLLLTNDTGPMHLAAALGTPVVVPFGSTSPELTGPGSPGHDDAHALLCGQAACAPCFLRECPVDFRCMHSITVEQVVQSSLRLVHARAAAAE